MLQKLLPQVARVSFDMLVFLTILLLFASRMHEQLPPPLQLVALKSMLVSAGLLTAHIAGKLLFPKVVWSGVATPAHYARIALYLVCVYAYSVGG